LAARPLEEKRLAMGERSSKTYAIKAAEPVSSKDINEERFEFALQRQNRKGKMKCYPFQR
jgi:hypothetical protein